MTASHDLVRDLLWDRPRLLKRQTLFHAITIGRKVRILFAPIYFRPAYAQIADDSDRSNVTKTKAFSHREASGADQSRDFHETAVHLALLTRRPLDTLRTLGPHALKEHEYEGITDSVAKHLEPFGGHNAFNVVRQQR